MRRLFLGFLPLRAHHNRQQCASTATLSCNNARRFSGDDMFFFCFVFFLFNLLSLHRCAPFNVGHPATVQRCTGAGRLGSLQQARHPRTSDCVRWENSNKRRNNNRNTATHSKKDKGPGGEQEEETHHRMRNEDLGLVAIVLLLHFLSRDRLEADLHHGSIGVAVPSGSRWCLGCLRLLTSAARPRACVRVCTRARERERAKEEIRGGSSSSRSWPPSPHCFCSSPTGSEVLVGFFFRALLKGAVRNYPVQRVTLNVTFEKRMFVCFSSPVVSTSCPPREEKVFVFVVCTQIRRRKTSL